MIRKALVAVLLLVLGARSPAAAEGDAVGATSASTLRHAIYVDAFGKGGLWGLGYDALVTPQIAIGATASMYGQDGMRTTTFSPYAALYPIGGARHRAFVQLGPQLVNVTWRSPVPEWPGRSSTGLGTQASVGYELRTRVLVRAYLMAVLGTEGIAPWAGISLGVAL